MVSVLARGALFQIQLFLDRTISIGLFFILAGVPFIINPFALDYWYKPKIDSVYALIAIIAAAALTRQLVLKKLPLCECTPVDNAAGCLRCGKYPRNNFFCLPAGQHAW